MPISSLPYDEAEVIRPFFPRAHEDEEVISPFVEDLSSMVDRHISDSIHIGRRGWDMGCFNFDGDPIYDIESDFQVKNDKLFP